MLWMKLFRCPHSPLNPSKIDRHSCVCSSFWITSTNLHFFSGITAPTTCNYTYIKHHSFTVELHFKRPFVCPIFSSSLPEVNAVPGNGKKLQESQLNFIIRRYEIKLGNSTELFNIMQCWSKRWHVSVSCWWWLLENIEAYSWQDVKRYMKRCSNVYQMKMQISNLNNF